MMRPDGGFTDNPFLGPWLIAANTAFDAWVGFWTATLPQQQATLVAEFQRQAMRAWTAPLAPWTGAEPPRPAPAPGPREAIQALRLPDPPAARPVTPPLEPMEEAVALRAAPAPVPPGPVAPAEHLQTPSAAAPAEPETPPRARKGTKGAAQLRATPPRKAAARKVPASKTPARKPAGRSAKRSPTRH